MLNNKSIIALACSFNLLFAAAAARPNGSVPSRTHSPAKQSYPAITAPASGANRLKQAVRTCRAPVEPSGAPATVEFVDYIDAGTIAALRNHGHGPSPPVAPETLRPLSSRWVQVPMVFPVVGPVHWRNGFNENRGHYRHTAIDIAAHKMQPVIAPFSGILGFKTQTFWIYADNGYRCLGTHLNDDTPGHNDNSAKRDFMFAPNIRPGDHVIAGQLIGYVGDSGNATGPHLHFELFAPDGILVNPCASLKVAYVMKSPRPAPVRTAVAISGIGSHIEACFRKWNASSRTMTVIVTTRKVNGRFMAASTPTWRQLTLTPEMVEAAGGDSGIESLPRDRPILFVPSYGGQSLAKLQSFGTALRLLLPSSHPLLAGGGNSLQTQFGPTTTEAAPEAQQPAGTVEQTPHIVQDEVFADFNEGTFDNWTLQGNCWTERPANDDTLRGAIRGIEGDGFVCTFHPQRGGAATGTAVSKEFTIDHPYINFLICGGQIPGEECLNLTIEGQTVLTATGNNRRTLAPVTWDVRKYLGKRARLEIVDRSEAPGLGYICVDYITFTFRSAADQD